MRRPQRSVQSLLARATAPTASPRTDSTPLRADSTPPAQRPPDWDLPEPPPPDPPPEKEPLRAALAALPAGRRTLHEAPRCSTSTV